MKIRLEDIIDLEYFISVDDDLESKADIESLALRDRDIFSQCKNNIHTPKDLLLSWLSIRKQQFFKHADKRTAPVLPGAVFSSFYTIMLCLMIVLGGILGITTVYSFLAYYGTLPINVMVFMFLFVALPFILFFAAFIVGLKTFITSGYKKNNSHSPAFISLITAFFLNGVPKILRKLKIRLFERAIDGIDYIAEVYDTRKEEFSSLFFWPLYILTSVFALGFSAGALAGTFFKVLVTDMAFGWQSTLVTSSQTVYDMVSFMAFPWSKILAKGVGWPSFEQIEGSRIVLKDGIQAMATQDLVSWWPFLCMAVIFYALIPRVFLILVSIWARQYQASRFDFEKPRFNQLILRMQSPVLDINSGEESIKKPLKKQGVIQSTLPSDTALKKKMPGNKACLLISRTVYDDDAEKKIIQHIKTALFFDVAQILPVCHDYEIDSDGFDDIITSGIDQVILVHEVWQPPIRGVLFYIRQIRLFLPEKISLCVMLTQDAGQDVLSVDKEDINFKIWEKAIAGLGYPDICLTRVM